MKKLASILSMTAMFIAMMASVAFAADDTTAAIDTGDTAWILISAALVFIMTPGLAFFYGGMVRSKNVLSTIMHSFFIVAMISVEWVLIGYAMVQFLNLLLKPFSVCLLLLHLHLLLVLSQKE